ncbi:hypothetical protein L1887_61880 [Cichorium endivia]|nr:hypothetical protein L1887_61880 [Cichorium endivia]
MESEGRIESGQGSCVGSDGWGRSWESEGKRRLYILRAEVSSQTLAQASSIVMRAGIVAVIRAAMIVSAVSIYVGFIAGTRSLKEARRSESSKMRGRKADQAMGWSRI